MEKKNTTKTIKNGSIPAAVLKNTIPSMIAMVMVLVYNLADTFFISQTHDALMVAAISLASPIFMIFIAIGNVFGIGATSSISRALGEGNKEKARPSTMEILKKNHLLVEQRNLTRTKKHKECEVER